MEYTLLAAHAFIRQVYTCILITLYTWWRCDFTPMSLKFHFRSPIFCTNLIKSRTYVESWMSYCRRASIFNRHKSYCFIGGDKYTCSRVLVFSLLCVVSFGRTVRCSCWRAKFARNSQMQWTAKLLRPHHMPVYYMILLLSSSYGRLKICTKNCLLFSGGARVHTQHCIAYNIFRGCKQQICRSLRGV